MICQRRGGGGEHGHTLAGFNGNGALFPFGLGETDTGSAVFLAFLPNLAGTILGPGFIVGVGGLAVV